MKRIVFFALILISTNASAQLLIDLYKKGTVKLIPESNYGTGNDWNTIFESYNDYYESAYGRKSPVGDRMSIIMMPDGSIIVNQPSRKFQSRFDPNGKYVKNFSISNNSGKSIGSNKIIQGVINNNFYTGADNTGKITCCDFDGNYVKTLTLNYMIKDMIPLKNNKLAVSGISIWKDKTRRFVSIVDYNTNKEKIIWDSFSADADAIVFDSSREVTKAQILEWSKVPPYDISYFYDRVFAETPIVQFSNDLLVVALPASGEIKMYNIDGKLQRIVEPEWKAESVSPEEQKNLLRTGIDKYKATPLTDKVSEKEATEARKQVLEILNEALNKIDKKIVLPVFSNVLKDSDGNLLFFEFPKEKGGNKFNVWIFREGGKFECQSSFECDDYELSITPSKMIFHKGYIYALQKAKNAQNIPLRLVKFRVSN